jgi:solute:Na+ symporter, SSS family
VGGAAGLAGEGVFVNALDYVVLLGTIVGIAGYGVWKTRHRQSFNTYLKGQGKTRWFTIGVSVMATQASAITFLSTPGQGYEGGLGFVQNYFGMPIALVVIAAIFLPIYRRLNVYTAYEYLGRRFDRKTRLLGAVIFLLQRGLGAGFTIYAPAIVLSSVLGWRLDLTIVCSGLVVIVYTALGGSDAVNVTQKQQMAVILSGMIAAGVMLWTKLPRGMTLADTMTLAGGFHKLQGVDFSFDWKNRYTFWSGIFGATFLMLSYFGADQSQVQRYISGASLRESRLGLMFNAVLKIPMQFFILLLGVLLFVFYQFALPPVYFNQVAWKQHTEHGDRAALEAIEEQFNTAHEQQQKNLQAWLDAHHSGDLTGEDTARAAALADQQQLHQLRQQAGQLVDPKKKTNDADYVFITFILDYLPHGLIGLLVAAFFAAALSSKAAELNALASTTLIDVYRLMIKPQASDRHYLAASRLFTAMWGLFAIGFALLVSMAENLIQATNILGSIFYPVILGVFVVGFFLRRIGGTAVFWGAVLAQTLVIAVYFGTGEKYVSYLWYNPMGCAAVMIFSLLLQLAIPRGDRPTEPPHPNPLPQGEGATPTA